MGWSLGWIYLISATFLSSSPSSCVESGTRDEREREREETSQASELALRTLNFFFSRLNAFLFRSNLLLISVEEAGKTFQEKNPKRFCFLLSIISIFFQTKFVFPYLERNLVDK